MEIVKGHNTDLIIKGQVYHVQTEDWGPKIPYIVTQVFLNGAVIETFKTDYLTAKLSLSLREVDRIKLALDTQHRFMLTQVEMKFKTQS
jgi:hypothetical protein